MNQQDVLHPRPILETTEEQNFEGKLKNVRERSAELAKSLPDGRLGFQPE